MLKLLLNSDRYALRKEFLFRFINIFLLFSIIGILITCILLFAPYIFIEHQERVVTEQITLMRNSNNLILREELENHEQELKRHFDIFKKETPEYSGFVYKVLEKTNSGILINSISFKIEDKDQKNKEFISIELRGQSDTRNSLVTYVDQLRNNETFEFVNLPLSNLTRDIDVPFVISIKTKGLNMK